MYNKKSLVTISLFTVLCAWTSYIANVADRDSNDQASGTGKREAEKTEFIDVHYYKTIANKPSFELVSSLLSITEKSLMEFNTPKGILVSSGREINYTATSGKIDQVKQTLFLKGNVELLDEKTVYKSDELSYNGLSDELTARGNVKANLINRNAKKEIVSRIYLTSNELKSFINKKILELRGDVVGKIKRRRAYEGKMDFKAQEVEVNSLKSQVSLRNSVEIRRNNYYLRAGNAEIFLDNFNKSLKYYTLYDDVKLEEKLKLQNGQKQLRRAFAEKLVAHQKSGKLVLSGAPRVEQGDDIIKGYQITLRENVELVEVDDAKSKFSLKREDK
jgi:lipopolysaccharide transport protein LptA